MPIGQPRKKACIQSKVSVKSFYFAVDATRRTVLFILVLMIRDEEFCSGLNNRATFTGFTSLHYAVLNDNFDLVQLLIEHGANPCIENESGHKPVTYAKEGKLKEYLTAETAKVPGV